MLNLKKVVIVGVLLLITILIPSQQLAVTANCDSQAGCEAIVTTLEKKSNELTEQLSKMSSTDRTSIESKMDLVNTYLQEVSVTRDDIQANINQLAEQSEQLEIEAMNLKDKVAGRMIHMQELTKGNVLLDFLVNSESLGDFIQRAMTLNDLTAYDQKLLNEMQTKLDQIVINTAVSESARASIDALYVSAQGQLDELHALEAKLVVELQKEAETLVAQQETVQSESSQVVTVPEGSYTNPLPGGYLMFPWGVCGDDYFGRCHTGIDLGAYVGAPVVAAASGVVSAAGSDSSRGNYVTISHGDGSTTQYYHLNSLSVSAGQSVNGGQSIGTMGATGFVTAPHLHFELWINGVNVDPAGYIGF